MDFIRGIAALLVLLNHFRNIFFVEFNNIDSPSVILTILYSITGLGHQAVVIFFVLSGFFISNSIFKKIKKNEWSWKTYLIDRLVRLYVVLIPVLIINYVFDLLGSYLFDYSFLAKEIKLGLEMLVFMGNLFFLQDILVPVLGSNDSLWSLTYEFWYYILFPLALLVFVSSKNVNKLLYGLIFVFIISILNYNSSKVLPYFSIWLLGTVVLLLPSIKIKNNVMRILLHLALFALFIITLGINRLELLSSGFLMDLLLAITFSSLVYGIIHINIPFNIMGKFKTKYYKVSSLISSFSFTLYLVHFPILIFIFAFFNNFGIYKMQPTLMNLIYGTGICLTIVLLAYLLSLITERKTGKIRLIVSEKINRKVLKKSNKRAG